MATAENAKLEYEAGQSAAAMAALTDSGDATTFDSAASLWSGKSGYAPVVRPNGLLTGGIVTPAALAGTDDVDVAALSCNLNGVVTVVSADADVAITRPATNVAKVCSITVNAAGAVAVVAGTDGATTAFSETRAAAGGPPLIPVDSIEIAQVRVTSSVAAVIAASEIFAVIGTHTESAMQPGYKLNYGDGSVTFNSALPKIHTGTVAKKVFASYAAPIFSEIDIASDFKPAEKTHSVSSTQVYGQTIGSSSSSLGQGGFTAFLDDGVSDALVAQKNEVLWFRFYPDKYKTAYMLTQGKLGIGRTFPAADRIKATCTISAEQESVEVA